MSQIAAFRLYPAGFLLVMKPNDPMECSEHRRSFGGYYGVDRLPLFFPPDPEIRRAIGEPVIENEALASLLQEWFDSGHQNTAFITHCDQAIRMLTSFRGFGFDLELIYCQIALQSDEKTRLGDYDAIEETDPRSYQAYGFDVSWPSCDHSAILQPGVVPSRPDWRARLNNFGLLSQYDDAYILREEYLRVYPAPPFDIYLVHGTGL
jgi:hypothetical protein